MPCLTLPYCAHRKTLLKFPFHPYILTLLVFLRDCIWFLNIVWSATVSLKNYACSVRYVHLLLGVLPCALCFESRIQQSCLNSSIRVHSIVSLCTILEHEISLVRFILVTCNSLLSLYTTKPPTVFPFFGQIAFCFLQAYLLCPLPYSLSPIVSCILKITDIYLGTILAKTNLQRNAEPKYY